MACLCYQISSKQDALSMCAMTGRWAPKVVYFSSLGSVLFYQTNFLFECSGRWWNRADQKRGGGFAAVVLACSVGASRYPFYYYTSIN